MSKHGNDDQPVAATAPSRWSKLQALLFTAGSIGTTLLTLAMLAETKLPRHQGE